MANTRSKTKPYLIASEETEIRGSKLPSNRQILSVFLYHHLTLGKTIQGSSKIVIREAVCFWKKARIPAQDERNSLPKVKKLYENWIKLKKNAARKTDTQRSNEKEFVDRLDDLFDIAHADAMKIITIQEDKEFLLAQREKGRRGNLAQVDKVLFLKENKIAKRKELITKSANREKKECEDMRERVSLAESESDADNSSDDDNDVPFEPTPLVSGAAKISRPRKTIAPSMAAALDRTNVSNRKASIIFTTAAHSLGVNVQEMATSSSAIRRSRTRLRATAAELIKQEFNPQCPIVVHWDGTLLPALSGKELVDRLPVIVSGEIEDKLLGVPKLQSGTGEAQASAVFKILNDWHIADKVIGMTFDTTSVNTGVHNGTCVLLEKKLNKNLLHLTCRHHMFEIIMSVVFTHCMGPSSGPDIPLYKRFKKAWSNLDKSKYEPGVKNKSILTAVENEKDAAIEFTLKQLKRKAQPRDDYREFLELVLIFLGHVPPRGVRLLAPGAVHHARWMAKILYAFKIYMFREQFHLTAREEKGLREITVFVINVYLGAWFTAPLPVSAPRRDLDLLQKLVNYEKKNLSVSTYTVALQKLTGHLWYLSEELIALAFFDSAVSIQCKKKMVRSLHEQNANKKNFKRAQLQDVHKCLELNLYDFVSKRSMVFFLCLGISTEFLKEEPERWENLDDYKQGLDTVRQFKVVNDNAERGVALIQAYNASLTKNEDQKQYLLQVVEQHRKLFPNSKKSTILKNL